MLDSLSEPQRVRLEVDGEAHPAVALELTGERAALRSRPPARGARRLAADDSVCVQLDWGDGTMTWLPGVVRAIAPAGPAGVEDLVHVEVRRAEGDSARLPAYPGPRAARRPPAPGA